MNYAYTTLKSLFHIHKIVLMLNNPQAFREELVFVIFTSKLTFSKSYRSTDP